MNRMFGRSAAGSVAGTSNRENTARRRMGTSVADGAGGMVWRRGIQWLWHPRGGTMQLNLSFGGQTLELELPEQQVIAHLCGPAGLADPGASVRHALEHPMNYPALR